MENLGFILIGIIVGIIVSHYVGLLVKKGIIYIPERMYNSHDIVKITGLDIFMINTVIHTLQETVPSYIDLEWCDKLKMYVNIPRSTVFSIIAYKGHFESLVSFEKKLKEEQLELAAWRLREYKNSTFD